MTYDYPALEKHLVDRFIHGKPLIQLEIPQVVFRKDVYSAMTFANIRKKIKPQVSQEGDAIKERNQEGRENDHIFSSELYLCCCSIHVYYNYNYIIILQVKLGDREQKDIINELRTTQDLRDCLDDVEIIIGFLSSSGADANIELRKYVKRALKIEDRFKSKNVSSLSCNIISVLVFV